MADLNRLRSHLTNLGMALGGVCLLSALYLIAPIGANENQLRQQLENAQAEQKNHIKELKPLEGMDKKLSISEKDMTEFKNKRLPSAYSEIAMDLGALAKDSKTQLSGAQYIQPDFYAGTDLQPIQMDVTVGGNYGNIIRFLNDVERSNTFFLVDSIGIAEQESGTVLQLKVSMLTFLRISDSNRPKNGTSPVLPQIPKPVTNGTASGSSTVGNE